MPLLIVSMAAVERIIAHPGARVRASPFLIGDVWFLMKRRKV